MKTIRNSGRTWFLYLIVACVPLSCEEEVTPPSPPDTRDYTTETRVVRDIDFIRNRYFWLNDPAYGGLPADPAHATIPLDVWVEINPADKWADPGLDWKPGKAFYDSLGDGAVIDAAAGEILAGSRPSAPYVRQDFRRLVRGRDYDLIADFDAMEVYGFVLTQAVPEDRAVAVNYVTTQNDALPGSPFTIGGPYSQYGIPIGGGAAERDTMLLELIKAKNPRPEDPYFGGTWRYMMRNFYNLGFTNIDPALFDLRIRDNTPRAESTRPEGSDVPYIRIFGFDQMNGVFEAVPDGEFDVLSRYLNLATGILQFPALFGFAPPRDSVSRWTAGEFSFADSLYEYQYEKALRLYTQYMVDPFLNAYQYDIVVEVKRLE